MNADLLLGFWALVLVLIAVPGPDWAFILGLSSRERVLVPAVGGLMIGYLLITAAVATGLAALLRRSTWALGLLTVVGAGYLVWLGVRLLVRPSATTAEASADGPVLVRGVGVSGLNPKGLLVFVAILPQFVDLHARWPTSVQLSVLGLVFVTTCGAFYLTLGLTARAVLTRLPALTTALSRTSGCAMVLVGVGLIVERVI